MTFVYAQKDSGEVTNILTDFLVKFSQEVSVQKEASGAKEAVGTGRCE